MPHAHVLRRCIASSHWPNVEAGEKGKEITREIREASSPNMRGHFGCIFKATKEYTTGVWWTVYMRIMDNGHLAIDNGHCVTSVAVAKKKRATMHMSMAMAMCGFMCG